MEKPARFTYPFFYEPHPLAILAAEEVKREIAQMNLTEGKMFGVLVVEVPPAYGFLAAYSGLLEGRNDWDYFVPPVFDAQQPDGHFKQTEQEITRISLELRTESGQRRVDSGQWTVDSYDYQTSTNSKAESNHNYPLSTVNSKLSTVNSTLLARRRRLSEDLQLWLFHQYQLLNARGETKDLVDIWQDYHCSPRIRKKFPLPPGGTGDCCAPKLLQYAYQHGLNPVCMAEFWWGPSPKSEIRHHGQYYPACRGKCKPVLTWMLQGLDVDPNPEEAGFPHLVPDIIYEDEAMAVVNKPSGLLSVPGRAERYSVATWAQKQWEGAMLVHRLDMWTSGILLVAKTKEAYLSLQQQFTERTVKKKYMALVEGTPQQEHGVIDLPLLNDPTNRPRQVVDFEHGKRAITEYRVVRPLGDQTLLALYPHTGRTHQLRMHCAHPEGLGCPIVGDELYGSQSDRLYLHAQAISFVHPLSGRRLHFEVPFAISPHFTIHSNRPAELSLGSTTSSRMALVFTGSK